MAYMERKCYVYAYLRAVADEHGAAGSPTYIGKGSGQRAFRKSTRPVGVPKDRSLIRFIATGLTEDEAYQLEFLLIEKYGRICIRSGCLYNIAPGGNHASPAPSTREKLRDLAKRRVIPPEQRQRMAEHSNSAKRTSEYRKHMSEMQTGKVKSLKTRKKLSIALRGKKRSDEARRRMSEARRQKNPSKRALYLREWRERKKTYTQASVLMGGNGGTSKSNEQE